MLTEINVTKKNKFPNSKHTPFAKLSQKVVMYGLHFVVN